MHEQEITKNDEHQNFNARNTDAKFIIVSRLINSLVREVNKYKLDYGTMRYVYRRVRERTGLTDSRKPKKLYQLPTKEELNQFFNIIDDPVHKLIFSFLLGTGVREAELTSIEISKINFSENTVFLTGKGKKDRLILMSDTLKAKIQIYLSNRNNRYLFESNRNTKFSTRRIQQLCGHYRFRANLTCPLTPHTFRHLFNTRLAEAGVSKEFRAQLSGHSSEQTQNIYTHLGIAGIAPQILKIMSELNL